MKQKIEIVKNVFGNETIAEYDIKSGRKISVGYCTKETHMCIGCQRCRIINPNLKTYWIMGELANIW